MAGMEDSHLRGPVLLCDLCMYEDMGKVHGISALSQRAHFPSDVPLFTAKLLASLPPVASPAQLNPVSKSLSLHVTGRTRNMPRMSLCQLG